MKRIIALAAVAGVLLAAGPADAAGCIKGAILGGIAAHVTHHSTLLGALGGCVVGHVLAHPKTSVSYDDVTGRMLGSDADLHAVEGASNVDIVMLSSLKGYRAGDKKTQQAIASNAQVKHLDSEIAADAALTATLGSSGFASGDVVAVSSTGGATLFVNR